MKVSELTEQELIHVLDLPDLSWQTCGPILEREGIELRKNLQGPQVWSACFYETRVAFDGKSRRYHSQNGPTPLIAAMRCFCCSKLGDAVDIPKELYED